MQVPNHTQVPNIIIDNMSKLEGSEIKVFLAICRKIIGWHKLTDRISYSQIKSMTGLSVNGIKMAIKNLVEKKIINQESVNHCFVYEINFGVSLIDIALNDMSIIDSSISTIDTKKSKIVSTIDTTKDNNKETIQKKPSKQKYLEFVLLTIKEYEKLNIDYGYGIIKEYIERLSDYIGSKGKNKYKSHYHTIKNWLRSAGIKPKIKSSDVKADLIYKKDDFKKPTEQRMKEIREKNQRALEKNNA